MADGQADGRTVGQSDGHIFFFIFPYMNCRSVERSDSTNGAKRLNYWSEATPPKHPFWD